jgi:two-component system, OmpR family, KDP operon response regulator KdpE
MTELLVVEDEFAMATVITEGLLARGYEVHTVASGADALAVATDVAVAAVILDLGLPDMDGLEVCRAIRAWSEVPIIVVTADGAEDRKIAALDGGADDYVTKPFSMRELLARVGVALRHHARRGPDDAVLAVGDLVIDVAHHTVTVAGEPVDLTPKQFDLLTLLARHPGRVLTHGLILSEVWGPEGAGHVEYLRVYARALRQKLREDPTRPRLITEPGVGYRLVDLGELPAPAPGREKSHP